jgi:sortase B
MKNKKIILRIILTICILAVIVFAASLVRELYMEEQSRSFYSDMKVEAETRSFDVDYYVNENNDWIPYVDFNDLNKIYPGIVGWIRLDGTALDYPIMQYTDNDHFLTHLPDGTRHRNGSIFLDYRNNSDFSDKSILIFGHETRAQDMFGALKNYREQEFYNANPVIYLHTPEKDSVIVLIAAYLADSERDHPPLYFESDEEFIAYIELLRRISFFTSDVEITPEDRIVSLCTCAYDFEDARLIITGILVDVASPKPFKAHSPKNNCQVSSQKTRVIASLRHSFFENLVPSSKSTRSIALRICKAS